MTPERFQQIAALYHSVRESSDGQRAALLDRADPELRREVESLLAQAVDGEFLTRPALEGAGRLWANPARPALAEGTRLGPYRIDGKLGEGGMGDVYRALDTRLGRAVAIKVSRTPFDARFRREAQVIASLNHPNICALYDVGPDYMVMELVEGETLAARLGQGALPTTTAVEYAAQMLAALAEAHATGIVHRDLKPGNVMLAKSGIKVLDFGLAKFLADETVTAADNVMGTPAYLAPEQRQGNPADRRSDIWSFGCVLYEMLTGARIGTRHRRICPRRLDRIVERCLEGDPARRWQSAAELATQLSKITAGGGWRGSLPAASAWLCGARRRQIVGAACAVATVVGVAGWMFLARPVHALTDQDTIVLAGFSNRTGDPVFDGTLRQGLSVQLEQSPFLSIVPDGRVRQTLAMMGRKAVAGLTPANAMEVCQRVGSAAVVDGSIAQIGAPYQLTIRAVDCTGGKTLASSDVDAVDKDHVLAALGKASSRIRAQLGESVRSVRRFDTPLEQATTSSLDALKAYSEGMRMLSAGSGIPAAVADFKRAIELDPDFAAAYGILTIAYTTLGESRIAAEYARKAYALRSNASEPEKYFITARYGKSATGNIDVAVEAMLAWIQAYPRAAVPRAMLAGSIYPVIGEYDKAAFQAAESIRLTPTLPVGYAFLMDACIALDRLDDARATYEQARRMNLHSDFYTLDLYQLAFLQHDPTEMARQLAASRGQPDIGDQMLAHAAEAAAYHGHLDEARHLSEQAMDVAQRAGAQEAAASYMAMSALREALVGSAVEAERRAASALERAPSRDVQYGAALAFAFAGNDTRAETLAEDLARQYPEDTLVRFNYLPVLRAKLAIDRGNASEALTVLGAATPYELAQTRSSALAWTSLYPIYIRGEAYLALRRGRQAAAEFRKILDHPGIALYYPVGPMARLRLATALADAGDRAGAATAYNALLDLWKDADPGMPALKRAKAEYAAFN